MTEELSANDSAQAAQAEEKQELSMEAEQAQAESSDPSRGGEEPAAVEPSAEAPRPEEPDSSESGREEPADQEAVEPAIEAEVAPDPVEASLRESFDEPAPETPEGSTLTTNEAVDSDELVFTVEAVDTERVRFKAIIEAVIYITDEPLTGQQIAGALGRPLDEIKSILEDLTADYAQSDRGLNIREVAGGYKMATKPEHHEEIRAFVKNLKPPLKLSLAALETLAVIAYKQPITAPEIMEIRGVQGAGVLKTLLDRKLIATAGRKNVVGKPILYKSTREFLVQFGLKDLNELPTLKEFEELGRLALTDADPEPGGAAAAPGAAPAGTPAAEPVDASDTIEPDPAAPSEPAEPPVPEPEDTSTAPAQDTESEPVGASDTIEPDLAAPNEPAEPPVQEPEDTSADPAQDAEPAPVDASDTVEPDPAAPNEPAEPPVQEPGPEPPPIEEPPPPPDQPAVPEEVAAGKTPDA